MGNLAFSEISKRSERSIWPPNSSGRPCQRWDCGCHIDPSRQNTPVRDFRKAKLTQSIPPENYRYNETRYTLQQSYPEAARKLLEEAQPDAMARWLANCQLLLANCCIQGALIENGIRSGRGTRWPVRGTEDRAGRT